MPGLSDTVKDCTAPFISLVAHWSSPSVASLLSCSVIVSKPEAKRRTNQDADPGLGKPTLKFRSKTLPGSQPTQKEDDLERFGSKILFHGRPEPNNQILTLGDQTLELFSWSFFLVLYCKSQLLQSHFWQEKSRWNNLTKKFLSRKKSESLGPNTGSTPWIDQTNSLYLGDVYVRFRCLSPIGCAQRNWPFILLWPPRKPHGDLWGSTRDLLWSRGDLQGSALDRWWSRGKQGSHLGSVIQGL